MDPLEREASAHGRAHAGQFPGRPHAWQPVRYEDEASQMWNPSRPRPDRISGRRPGRRRAPGRVPLSNGRRHSIHQALEGAGRPFRLQASLPGSWKAPRAAVAHRGPLSIPEEARAESLSLRQTALLALGRSLVLDPKLGLLMAP